MVIFWQGGSSLNSWIQWDGPLPVEWLPDDEGSLTLLFNGSLKEQLAAGTGADKSICIIGMRFPMQPCEFPVFCLFVINKCTKSTEQKF